jgi:hypothetical protein
MLGCLQPQGLAWSVQFTDGCPQLTACVVLAAAVCAVNNQLGSLSKSAIPVVQQEVPPCMACMLGIQPLMPRVAEAL